MDEEYLDEEEEYIEPGSHLPKSDSCWKCGNFTAFGKPWCILHLDQLDYVQQIKRELEVRAHEEANAHKKFARIDLKGTRATEILDLIAYRGALTLSRISSELDLPRKALKGYLARLEQAGMLSTGTLLTKRKATIRVAMSGKKERKKRKK